VVELAIGAPGPATFGEVLPELAARCEVVVVGGCGRAGLPLSVALANAGLSVTAVDRDAAAVRSVAAGRFPFVEADGGPQLKLALQSGRLHVTTDAAACLRAEVVIVVIGTPVDEYLNPDPDVVVGAVAELREHLCQGQLLVLRSTLCAGVTARVERLLEPLGVEVTYCPERTAEGLALRELPLLPQLIGARSDEGRARSAALFRRITEHVIEVEPEEAELAKLFTNAWRYVRFAAANQFFMVANDLGIDFERVRTAMTMDYPRVGDLPPAGLTAGPCLLKDTMQLAGSQPGQLALAQAAMSVNEGLPAYLVRRVESRRPLAGLTVGIMGMAFKAESDDIRSSLAYKLRRLLRSRADTVLCTDPYVTDDATLVPLEVVLDGADLVFIGAPHEVYRRCDLSGRDVVDVWNLLGRGVLT